MTLNIELPPSAVQELEAEAKATGKDVETLVRDAITARLARRTRTFAEVLAPLNDAIEASGLSSEQIEKLLKEELAELRADRKRPGVGS